VAFLWKKLTLWVLIVIPGFRYGKNEYTSENWNDCVGFMRRACEDFNYYRDEMLWCRQKCAMVVEESEERMELSIMYTMAQKALCLLRWFLFSRIRWTFSGGGIEKLREIRRAMKESGGVLCLDKTFYIFC
jgi:hypothetical protein